MPALLGQLLIFDLHSCQTGLLEFLYGAHDRERRAEACIRIHDCRNRHSLGNGGGIGHHLCEGQKPDIRQSPSSRNRRAGDIEGLEPGALDLHGRQAIERSRQDNGLLIEQFAETPSFGLSGLIHHGIQPRLFTFNKGINAPTSFNWSSFQTASITLVMRVRSNFPAANWRNLSSTSWSDIRCWGWPRG